MTPEQLNEIIRELKNMEESPYIPYCKGMVYRNSVVRLLKKYVK